MSESKLLFNLQKSDTKVSTINIEIRDTKFKLNDDSSIVKAKDLNGLVLSKLTSIKSIRNKLEKNLQILKDKSESINTKIYSGFIKTEKELTALQEELANLSKLIEETEDEILTIMIDQDRYTEGLEKSSIQLSEAEETRQRNIPELKHALCQLESEFKSASIENKKARSKCSNSALMKYDQLCKTHKGIGVSTLVSNLCSTCRVSVPTKTIQELKSATSFVFCNSCQRILCLPD